MRTTTIIPRRARVGEGHRARGPADRCSTAEQVGEMLGVPKSWVYEQSRRAASRP